MTTNPINNLYQRYLHDDSALNENALYTAISNYYTSRIERSKLPDDLAQIALIDTWKWLPKFRGDAQLTTCLYRILRHVIYRYRRERKDVELVPRILDTYTNPCDDYRNPYDEDCESESADESEDTCSNPYDSLLRNPWEVFACLNDDEKKVAKLLTFGYSQAEIASMLGTYQQRVSAMTATMRTKLGGQVDL